MEYQYRLLPTELLFELFGSLPLENGFALLAKMPNGILARNIGKSIKGLKETLKGNKWNEADCGPKLSISEAGLVVKHSGPIGWNCVRALLAIPKINLAIKNPIITFYYEVRIINTSYWSWSINIGFCDKLFALQEKGLAQMENSVGIGGKREPPIHGYFITYGNEYGYFNPKNVIGIGIIQDIHSQLVVFSTWNGKLTGKGSLPSNFANRPLFPAITMRNGGDEIHANFMNKNEWRYKDFANIL